MKVELVIEEAYESIVSKLDFPKGMNSDDHLLNTIIQGFGE